MERQEWIHPTVGNPRLLLPGSSSIDVHMYTAKQLILDGKLAFLLIDDGAKLCMSEEMQLAIATADLWQVVREWWPNKVRATISFHEDHVHACESLLLYLE